MYSTCTFCHAPLGRNESLEHFSVGERLAFDQARGRLWVVCPSCQQWNLSPLEQRWEAIEAAERLYRDTRLRVATDNIGLARLKDGTELIRIGQPQRPEFAGWRYGTRFGTRWRRAMIAGGAGSAAWAAWSFAGVGLSLSVFGALSVSYIGLDMVRELYFGRVVAGRFADDTGPLYMNRNLVDLAMLVPVPDDPRGWGWRVPAVRGTPPSGRFAPGPSVFNLDDHNVTLVGRNADEAARFFLPAINRKGGRKRTVAEAVELVEKAGSRDEIFRKAAALATGAGAQPVQALLGQPASLRLALEMAAHEETERRALEGELAALEAVWREAEEIAAIADGLTLPERVTQRLERLLKDR